VRWKVKSARPAFIRASGATLSRKPFSASGLARHQKRTGKFSSAAQFERPEIPVPITLWHIRVLRFPFSQIKEVVNRNLPLPGAIAKVSPRSRGSRFHRILGIRHYWAFFNIGHSSTAENESTKFVYYPILVGRIVVS